MTRLELISSPEYIEVMFKSAEFNYKNHKKWFKHLRTRVKELQKELVSYIPSLNQEDGK